MKAIRTISALILSAALFSCQKNEIAEVPVLPSDDAAFGVIDVNTYTASEFANLFEGVDAPAETKCAALSYEIARLSYQSVNGSGEPVTLSMKIAYPEGILTRYHDPDYIVLENHPTICSQAESPYMKNPYTLAKALEDALVVCPDYEGFGISVDSDHPYLCQDLNARQSVDAVLAAIDYINAKRGIKMSKGYYLENYGYSQGGGIALAVHKYIENSLNAADQAKLNLRSTSAGGGTYDMPLMMKLYFEEDDVEYPAIVPLMLIGFKTAYPQIMDGIELSDLLEADFIATGIIDRIRSKQYTIDELNTFIEQTYGTRRCSRMLVPEFFNEESDIRQAVNECLALADATKGWSPVRKVSFFHSKKDQIVPMENALSAYGSLKGGNVAPIDWAPLSPDHRTTAALWYVKIMGLNIVPGLIGSI